MVKKYDFEIFIKYSVARTPQVGKSKLQITSDEKKSQVAKGHMWFFLSQVICNFDFPMREVPATILYDCAIINHKN